MRSHTFMSTSRAFMSIYLMFLFVLLSNAPFVSGASKISHHQVHEDYPSTTVKKLVPVYARNRKMILGKGLCTSRDISISQSQGSSSGIPQYIVQIVNTCMSGCAPSNIHLHCGWFASAKLVNPKTFKRVSFDECLVNGGRGLRSFQTIRFTYSNSFMYPIWFKSARFC